MESKSRLILSYNEIMGNSVMNIINEFDNTYTAIINFFQQKNTCTIAISKHILMQIYAIAIAILHVCHNVLSVPNYLEIGTNLAIMKPFVIKEFLIS